MKQLRYSLDSLPRCLFRGFSRRATATLFERLDATYRSVEVENTGLRERIEEIERALVERRQNEQRLVVDLENRRAELDAAHELEQTLHKRLQATAEAAGTAELARSRTEAAHELELVKAKLADCEKRERLLAELVNATRKSVEQLREEARAEAELILAKARKREQQILDGARRERDRLEAERGRLATMAADLHSELVGVLDSTLEQLKRTAGTEPTADRTTASPLRQPTPGPDGSTASVQELKAVRKERFGTAHPTHLDTAS